MAETRKLTTKFIESYDPEGSDTIIWDVAPKGFGVRFYKSGKIAFIVQRRVGSGRLARQRKMTVGVYPQTNLAEARKAAIDAIAKLQHGADVVEEKNKILRREKEAKAAEITVGELCDRWIVSDARRSRMRGPRFGTLRDPKNVRFNAAQIERHIKPIIGHIKLSDLTRKHIERLRDDISDGKTAADVKTKKHGRARVTGGEGTATKCVRTLGSILSYAVREELIPANPASNIQLAPSRKVERYLTKEENARLEKVLADMEKEPKYEKGCAIIRVLMLTGCRRNEIESLKWSEIDFERGFVALSKSKTGGKIIPFSKAALNIITAQPRLQSSEFVFPSTKINDWYKGLPKVWYVVRRRAKIEDCRLHDLRHNFASVAASNGASLPMIGAPLERFRD